MPESARPVTTIRIRREALREARIAAVTVGKTLGQWLESAIAEKVAREEAGQKGKGRKDAGNK
jgi:hypothetical protein